MGDITTGYSFSVAETNITDVKLNAIAGSAVINSTFVTGKSAAAANPDPSAYLFLLTDPASSTFYKASINSAVFTHASLYNGNSAITTLAGTEIFPVYDGANKKITADNLFASSRLIKDQTAYTAPVGADKLLVYSTVATANRGLTLGNLIKGATAVTNVLQADELLIGDGTSSFTKITAYNLFSGAAAAETTVASGDEVAFRDVSATSLKRITVLNLLGKGILTGTPITNMVSSDEIPVASAAGVLKQIDAISFKKDVQLAFDYNQTTAAWTQSINSQTWTQVESSASADDFGLAITPISATSKILLTFNIMAATGTATATYFRIKKVNQGVTSYLVADVAGSRAQATGGQTVNAIDTAFSRVIQYVDAPAQTTLCTYTLEIYSTAATTLYVNRTGTDTNSAAFARGTSMSTAQEFA